MSELRTKGPQNKVPADAPPIYSLYMKSSMSELHACTTDEWQRDSVHRASQQDARCRCPTYVPGRNGPAGAASPGRRTMNSSRLVLRRERQKDLP